MQWRDAVLASLRSYSARHQSRVVERQQFIAEELGDIAAATGSSGATPSQTLSRILQELRDAGLLEFLERGHYLLLDAPIDIEAEDLTDEAVDVALKANKLKLGNVETADQTMTARRRRGQDRLRRLVLSSYGVQCAVCDVTDLNLLIASHIVGWAEAPEHRGDLTNVICLCRIHDCLFERGYWSLDDGLRVLRQVPTTSAMLQLILEHTTSFRVPPAFGPASGFLQMHRIRSGFAA
jgi:hypothetical protein